MIFPKGLRLRRPTIGTDRLGAAHCTTPAAGKTMSMLGRAARHGSLSLTRREYRSLQRAYGFTAEASELMQGGADKSMMRYAEADGTPSRSLSVWQRWRTSFRCGERVASGWWS